MKTGTALPTISTKKGIDSLILGLYIVGVSMYFINVSHPADMTRQTLSSPDGLNNPDDNQQFNRSLEIVADWLMERTMTQAEIEDSGSKEPFDFLVITGSHELEGYINASLPLIRKGLFRNIILSGGVGNGTPGLLQKAKANGYLEMVPELRDKLEEIERTLESLEKSPKIGDEKFREIVATLGPDGLGITESLIMKSYLLWKMNEVYGEESAKTAEEKILLEGKSTNSGQNIRFSLELIDQKNLIDRKEPLRILLMQNPVLQKRTRYGFYREYEKWIPQSFEKPELALVSFSGYTFDDLSRSGRDMESFAQEVFNEVLAIVRYGPKGFITLKEANEFFDIPKADQEFFLSKILPHFLVLARHFEGRIEKEQFVPVLHRLIEVGVEQAL